MYPVVPASRTLYHGPSRKLPEDCGPRISKITRPSSSKILPLNPIPRAHGPRFTPRLYDKLERSVSAPLIPRFAPRTEQQSRALCEVPIHKPIDPAWLPSAKKIPPLPFSPDPISHRSFPDPWQISSYRPEIRSPIIAAPFEITEPKNEDCLCKTVKKQLSRTWAAIRWIVRVGLYIPKTLLFGFASNPSPRKSRRRGIAA